MLKSPALPSIFFRTVFVRGRTVYGRVSWPTVSKTSTVSFQSRQYVGCRLAVSLWPWSGSVTHTAAFENLSTLGSFNAYNINFYNIFTAVINFLLLPVTPWNQILCPQYFRKFNEQKYLWHNNQQICRGLKEHRTCFTTRWKCVLPSIKEPTINNPIFHTKFVSKY